MLVSEPCRPKCRPARVLAIRFRRVVSTMASEMNVTTETLRSYVKNVLAKLGARSRVEAASLAGRYGI